MPRFSDMTNRWDQWVLMRCPLLWQLRLHWYLPLALLWCVLVLGIWMQWMAEPARWMGSLPGVASTARQTPEQLALDIGFVVAWIVAIGLALWWLLRVRIHNRWREHAPVGRWGLWWEYLWGALFLSLLFAPAIAFSPIYEMRMQRQWSDTDVSAQIQTVEQVAALEALVAPRQAAMLVEWIRVLREEEVDPAKYPSIQALVWLMRGDQAAIAATLERYGQPLQARGYVRQSASSARDEAEHLLASYRSALQSPLAEEWRAYLAASPPSETGEKVSRAQNSNCKPAWGRSRPLDLEPDPRKCFGTYLAQSNREWLMLLEMFDSRWSPLQHVQWKHARYGLALPAYQESHLRRADRSRDDEWPRMSQLLAAASAGFFLALALVLVRLMPAMQLVAWGACLVLTMLGSVLAGMLGITNLYVLGLFPAALISVAWLRIRVLKRPWAGAVLLALGMSLALIWLAAAWSKWSALLLPQPAGSAGLWTDTQHWLDLLMGAPAVAASTAMLVALLSPLWRRWRGLPER